MNQKSNTILLNKSKIAISLIHDNNEERLSCIRPRIDDLVSELRKKMEVEFCEISWQPNLKPASLRVGFLRDSMYWKLNREWTRYRKYPNRFFLFDFLIFTAKAIFKYIFNPGISKRWLNSCAIEMIVSDKHIRAFTNALENKADYLLVFEDDAVFKKDSINKLSSLIDELEVDNKISTYIDLGGGASLMN